MAYYVRPLPSPASFPPPPPNHPKINMTLLVEKRKKNISRTLCTIGKEMERQWMLWASALGKELVK